MYLKFKQEQLFLHALKISIAPTGQMIL